MKAYYLGMPPQLPDKRKNADRMSEILAEQIFKQMAETIPDRMPGEMPDTVKR